MIKWLNPDTERISLASDKKSQEALLKVTGSSRVTLFTQMRYTNSILIIKVFIAAQKFATSILMSAPLKVVTIECIEHLCNLLK